MVPTALSLAPASPQTGSLNSTPPNSHGMASKQHLPGYSRSRFGAWRSGVFQPQGEICRSEKCGNRWGYILRDCDKVNVVMTQTTQKHPSHVATLATLATHLHTHLHYPYSLSCNALCYLLSPQATATRLTSQLKYESSFHSTNGGSQPQYLQHHRSR